MTAPAETRDRYAAMAAEYGLWEVVDTEKDIAVGAVGSRAEAAEAAQRLNALGNANAKRIAGAEFKRGIKTSGPVDGAREVAALLLGERNQILESLRLYDVLTAIPKVGRTRATTWISAIGVHASANRRVRDLTPRQREALARMVGDHADRSEVLDLNRDAFA